MKKLLDYEFEFVDFLSPVKDRNGQIKEFYPQENYAKKDITPLNKYGEGAFCRFSISPKWSGVSGVYAFFIEDDLVYIGQCLDFAARFNLGYGNISPKNCYVGGQSTNCKINNLVLNSVKASKAVSLFFHKSPSYDIIERELITHYKPKYNVSLVSPSYVQPRKNNQEMTSARTNSNNTSVLPSVGSIESICQYIIQRLKNEKQQGAEECILISGNIHKDLMLLNKMPSVCSAMYKVMKTNDEILFTTASGKSSTIKIKYYLNDNI